MRLPLPKKHWTPRYLAARARLAAWQRRHPSAPWLEARAIDFLDQWLDSSDTVVEFGAGRSTAWFAPRVGRLVSVEHHPEWFATVRDRMQASGHDHVTCHLAAAEPDPYTAAAASSLDGPADLILVDGRVREHCALWALDHVREGGLIVIDNAERYLANPARTPESIGDTATPPSEGWIQVANRIADRRQVWWDNGVWATLLVFV